MPNEQYAIMPLSDYEDACDAIRAKTGGSALIKSGDMASEIDSIQTGGGGITPTGTKQIVITQNGTTTEDVTQYANAEITVNVPSGASLPAVISKIDGGSFTLASDTALNSHILSHNLGERPKGLVLWSDNNGESGGSYAVQTILYGFIINSEFLYGSAHNYGLFFEQYRKTNDYPTNIALGLSEAQRDLALTATTCAFVWRSGEYYKAGLTYKWLAWA